MTQTAQPKNNEFDTGNFFTSLVETIKGVLLTPADFFKGMPKKVGYGPPIIFGVIMFAISGFLGGLVGSTVTNFNLGGQTPAPAGGIGAAFAGLIGGPIAFVILSWVAAGILHLFCLMFTGGAKGGYEGTYRVGAYSSAVALATWIPIIGFLASLYQLYIMIIGIREVHETTTGRAAAAVLVPVLIILVLAVIAVAVLAAALVGVLGGMGATDGFQLPNQR